MSNPVPPRPSPPLPDRLFLDFQSTIAGRYSLERELGRGGMGVVFLARDLKLDRVVAVKLLPPDHARNGALRERFVREARTAAKLSHPHIVPIHAVEEAGDFVYFVMAYVEGDTLGARVRRDGPLPPHDAARVLREVAWALAYAHAQGVIHRDVKPDNILLEARSGRALVADFGIARLVQGPGVSGEGELVGTPEYMSPEQATADAVDGRSDLYSLGVVGYFALSGRLPFTAPNVPAILVQHATQPPPPLVAPYAPRSLVSAVERCLAKDPARRFASGEALADALAQALETRPDLPMPVRAFLAEDHPQVRVRFVLPFMAAALIVPIALGFVTELAFPGPVPLFFRRVVIGISAVLAGVGLASPLVLQIRAVRRLLRGGFTRDDLERGLKRDVERRREEMEFAFGAGPTRWERLMRLKSRASLVFTAACAVGAFVLPYPQIQIALAGFVLGAAATLATALASRELSRRRLEVAEGARLKSWRGWWGRLIFRIAGIRLGRAVSAPAPADRPTEVALGLAALELFEGLPKDTRRQLGDLPSAVRALEQDAARLRYLPDAGRQREAALGALENLRLDLMRLASGLGTVDSLTQDLEAARGVGEDVDRLLEGLKETDGDGEGR